MLRVVVFGDNGEPLATCDDPQVVEACLKEIAVECRMQALFCVERNPERAEALCRQAAALDGRDISLNPALNEFWDDRREMANAEE